MAFSTTYYYCLSMEKCSCGVEAEGSACMMQESRFDDVLAGNKEKVRKQIKTSRINSAKTRFSSLPQMKKRVPV